MGFFGAAYGLWRGRLKILYIILLTCIESLKVFLINMNTILMMLAKLAPPGLRKTVFFSNGFFSFTNIRIHRPAGEGGGYLFNSSLPLSPASKTLRH